MTECVKAELFCIIYVNGPICTLSDEFDEFARET